MIRAKKLFVLVPLAICLFGIQYAFAQSFKPDASGYVADPKFHKLIKSRGYSLVETYDTVSRNPLKVYARVIHQGQKKEIDLYGKEVPKEAPQKISAGEMDNIQVDIIPEEIPPPAEDGMLMELDSFEQVVKNGKSGTRNKYTGKQGIPAVYDRIVFYNGSQLVAIIKDTLQGLALFTGKVIIQPRYQHINFFGVTQYPFDLAIAKRNGKYCLLGGDGKELCPPKYDYIQDCYGCLPPGYLQVHLNSKYGVINKAGKEIIPPIYTSMSRMTGTQELLRVAVRDSLNKKKYGVIDTLGAVRLPLEYQDIETINGHYVVTQGSITRSSKKALLGYDARLLTPFAYDNITRINDTYGVAIVENRSMYGMISLDGKTLIKEQYGYLYPYYTDSLVAVQYNRKWGFFDLQGNEVFPVEYQQLYYLKPYFFFHKDTTFGLMNRKKEIIRTFPYELMIPCGLDEHHFIVRKNGKEGVVNADQDFKEIVQLKYEHIIHFNPVVYAENGIFMVERNGYMCKADRYGNVYCEE